MVGAETLDLRGALYASIQASSWYDEVKPMYVAVPEESEELALLEEPHGVDPTSITR